jgi:acyl carrier protein
MTETTTQADAGLRRDDLVQWVKSTLVQRLSLRIKPEEIDENIALFGSGLQLDSVDAFELAMAIESEYGIPVADDDVPGFGSVGLIADFIIRKQASRAS